jgi:hypothetical protein
MKIRSMISWPKLSSDTSRSRAPDPMDPPGVYIGTDCGGTTVPSPSHPLPIYLPCRHQFRRQNHSCLFFVGRTTAAYIPFRSLVGELNLYCKEQATHTHTHTHSHTHSFLGSPRAVGCGWMARPSQKCYDRYDTAALSIHLKTPIYLTISLQSG